MISPFTGYCIFRRHNWGPTQTSFGAAHAPQPDGTWLSRGIEVDFRECTRCPRSQQLATRVTTPAVHQTTAHWPPAA